MLILYFANVLKRIRTKYIFIILYVIYFFL